MIMRLTVTRPQADSERTATALRARGHQVLVAPLMRVGPVAADLRGSWAAVIMTSANAPAAIAAHPARDALIKLEIRTQQVPMQVAPAFAPLYIVNPFGKSRTSLSALFSTHPPMQDRIRRLEVMAQTAQSR